MGAKPMWPPSEASGRYRSPCCPSCATHSDTPRPVPAPSARRGAPGTAVPACRIATSAASSVLSPQPKAAKSLIRRNGTPKRRLSAAASIFQGRLVNCALCPSVGPATARQLASTGPDRARKSASSASIPVRPAFNTRSTRSTRTWRPSSRASASRVWVPPISPARIFMSASPL